MEMDNSWANFTISRGPIRGLERNRVGLIIKIQARKELEEFMKNLAGGQQYTLDIDMSSWHNANPTNGPLQAYEANIRDAAKRYTLDALGQEILIPAQPDRMGRVPPGDDQINLSFLKLVGISNPEGVTIGLPGAYSADYINRIRTVLPAAVKRFLEDYIVPITINLHIVNRN